jgi:hypothetical protein
MDKLLKEFQDSEAKLSSRFKSLETELQEIKDEIPKVNSLDLS